MQPPTEIQGYFSDFGAPPEDIKILLLNPNGHAHERRSMLLEPEVLKFPQDLDDHVIGDRVWMAAARPLDSGVLYSRLTQPPI